MRKQLMMMRRRRRGRAGVTMIWLLMVANVCEGEMEIDREALVGLEVIRICGRASLNTLGMTAAAHTLLATR